MKLLIVTQKIDINDPILGFFHRWVEEFSKHCEKLTVITLGVGKHDLPPNVKVLSLGKEDRDFNSWYSSIIRKFVFLYRFYKFIWQERKNYDRVFVHMNQEYILLGWELWRLLGKKIMLWRNHPMGNFLTNTAVFLSDRVFCTSKYAYTAKFKKTEIMPVGIDTDLFKRKPEIKKISNSILFLGRISPIKNPDILIEALNILNKEQINFNALMVGDPLSKDMDYYESLKNKINKYGLENKVKLMGGVKHSEAIDLYNKYEIFVNLTPTGSMDKTIFEAMACESLVLVSNKSLESKINNELIFKEGNFNDLAEKLKNIIDLFVTKKNNIERGLRDYVVKEHGLRSLIKKII